MREHKLELLAPAGSLNHKATLNGADPIYLWRKHNARVNAANFTEEEQAAPEHT